MVPIPEAGGGGGLEQANFGMASFAQKNCTNFAMEFNNHGRRFLPPFARTKFYHYGDQIFPAICLHVTLFCMILMERTV